MTEAGTRAMSDTNPDTDVDGEQDQPAPQRPIGKVLAEAAAIGLVTSLAAIGVQLLVSGDVSPAVTGATVAAVVASVTSVRQQQYAKGLRND